MLLAPQNNRLVKPQTSWCWQEVSLKKQLRAVLSAQKKSTRATVYDITKLNHPTFGKRYDKHLATNLGTLIFQLSIFSAHTALVGNLGLFMLFTQEKLSCFLLARAKDCRSTKLTKNSTANVFVQRREASWSFEPTKQTAVIINNLRIYQRWLEKDARIQREVVEEC